MNRRARPLLAAILAVALVAGGCTSTTPSPSSRESAGLLPQPEPPEGLEVAPDEARVDLRTPTFSDPTTITNPYFPVSSQQSVLLVGTVNDMEFRTEVTLLPNTRILEWNGQPIEVLVSQYVAFLDGRLHEVAYDLYAQADDGSVWYFGEDVFNFASGAIVDTHGTWIAGIDGPAAMIMPADPRVGDVYRPENIPGLVFEEVTVSSVDETLDGPFGPIEDGLVVTELHMDGGTEEKRFAPDYGEFYTDAGGDLEAVVLAVPTDAADGPEPEPLTELAAGIDELLRALDAGDATAAAESLGRIRTAREAYPADAMPALLGPIVDAALERLGSALADGDDGTDSAAAQATIDLGRLVGDLRLRYRPQLEIEIDRFDLWLAQLRLDAAAEDAASVNGDYFALDYVRERFATALHEAQAAELNLGMEDLLSAIGEEDFAAAAEIALDLQVTRAEVSRPS